MILVLVFIFIFGCSKLPSESKAPELSDDDLKAMCKEKIEQHLTSLYQQGYSVPEVISLSEFIGEGYDFFDVEGIVQFSQCKGQFNAYLSLSYDENTNEFELYVSSVNIDKYYDWNINGEFRSTCFAFNEKGQYLTLGDDYYYIEMYNPENITIIKNEDKVYTPKMNYVSQIKEGINTYTKSRWNVVFTGNVQNLDQYLYVYSLNTPHSLGNNDRALLVGPNGVAVGEIEEDSSMNNVYLDFFTLSKTLGTLEPVD